MALTYYVVLISGLVAVVLNLILPEESVLEMAESDSEYEDDVVAVEEQSEQKGSSHSTEKH